MPVRQEIREGRVPVKVYTDLVEEAARRQLVNISQLPIVHHHVAAMPDVHHGIGATVGSVIPTLRAIIPAAVGVDIGCGMIAARLSLTANEIDEASLKKVFAQISRDVPVGFEQHDERDARSDAAKPFKRGLRAILDKHPGVEKRVGKNSSWVRQLGTSVADVANGIASAGTSLYVTGTTLGSLDGNNSLGLSDSFLLKFNTSGAKQ